MNEFFDWDWQGAEERFRRAIELDGNYATAHQWYAEYLAHQGRFDEALGEIEAARRLDPVSLIIWSDRAAILYYARRYPEAIDQFRAVMDMQPLFARSGMIILSYVQEKRLDEALAQVQQWQGMVEGQPWLYGLSAYVYGLLGRMEEARKALEDMEESGRRLKLPADLLLGDRTRVYCGMGLREEVLASLQVACEARSPHLVALKVDAIYDFVRDDPRFQDLLRCVRLAP
jgi:tetratricopeptide (TPR) repeat protein